MLRICDYYSFGGGDVLYARKSWLTRRRAKPKSSTTITTAQSGTERSTQVMVVPHFAMREDDEEWGYGIKEGLTSRSGKSYSFVPVPGPVTSVGGRAGSRAWCAFANW